MEEVGKKLADTINEIILGGIPIPFVLATMDLIHHDLCNQHIAMTNQMAQIAKGNLPIPEVRNIDKPSDNVDLSRRSDNEK